MRRQVIGVAVLWAAVATGQELLDLDAVLEHARKPALLEKQRRDHQIVAAHQANREARALILPRLDWAQQSSRGQQKEPGEGATFNTHEASLTLSSPLYRFGQVSAALRLYEEETQRIVLQSKQLHQQFRLSVLETFSRVATTQRQVDLAERSRNLANRTYRFVETERGGGAATQIHVLRAKSEWLLAQSAFEDAQVARERELGKLAVLLDLAPSRKPRGIRLETIESSQFWNTGLGPLGFRTEGDPLEIQLIGAELASLREQTYAASRAYAPSLDLFMRLDRNLSPAVQSPSLEFEKLGDFSKWNARVGISLQWNLFQGWGTEARHYRLAAQVKAAEADLAQKRREWEVQQHSLESELKAIEISLAAAKEAEIAMEQVLTRAETDYRQGQVRYEDLIQVARESADVQRVVTLRQMQKVMFLALSRMRLGRDVF